MHCLAHRERVHLFNLWWVTNSHFRLCIKQFGLYPKLNPGERFHTCLQKLLWYEVFCQNIMSQRLEKLPHAKHIWSVRQCLDWIPMCWSWLFPITWPQHPNNQNSHVHITATMCIYLQCTCGILLMSSNGKVCPFLVMIRWRFTEAHVCNAWQKKSTAWYAQDRNMTKRCVPVQSNNAACCIIQHDNMFCILESVLGMTTTSTRSTECTMVACQIR